MIIICQGPLGSGKTLTMSTVAEMFHYRTGLALYANYGLSNAHNINSFETLFNLRNGIVAIDEFHVLIDSRMFKAEKQIQTTHWLLQTRKKSLIILGTSQDIDQVDLRLRRVVDVLIDCKKVGGLGNLRTLATMWYPVGTDIWVKKGVRMLDHSPFMYSLYDTYQEINPLK